MAASDAMPSWRRRLEERLRWDLLNARRMQVSPGRLTLVGYGGRDFATGLPTHESVQIQYQVEADASGSRLLRTEFHLDAITNHHAETEVLCVGVGGLAAGRLEESWQDLVKQAKAAPTAAVVPSRLRCVLTDSDGGLLQEFVVIQGAGSR